jgi:hypothetical protein
MPSAIEIPVGSPGFTQSRRWIGGARSHWGFWRRMRPRGAWPAAAVALVVKHLAERMFRRPDKKPPFVRKQTSAAPEWPGRLRGRAGVGRQPSPRSGSGPTRILGCERARRAHATGPARARQAPCQILSGAGVRVAILVCDRLVHRD